MGQQTLPNKDEGFYIRYERCKKETYVYSIPKE